MQTFEAPPAISLLDKIVDRVLISPSIPFKLDYKVFQFLIENFLNQDFSVRNFLERWKFMLGEHFSEQPASLLCCPLGIQTDRLEAMSNR